MESSASEPLVPLQSLPLADSRPFFRGSAAPSASLLLVARPLCFPLGGVREKVECTSTWGWHQPCAQGYRFPVSLLRSEEVLSSSDLPWQPSRPRQTASIWTLYLRNSNLKCFYRLENFGENIS